jgi:site-specific DNA-cytosine methylase
MNVVDLFSCIGGHALGLAAAGDFEVTNFVEIHPGRRALLEHRFPGISVASDVRYFHPVTRGGLLVGGPPCQQTSVASAIHGKRNGESLWPEMRRVSRELAPKWVVVEQPPGNAAWEAQVRDDLAADGFHTARVEFAACDLGAPYIRRRVFIFAHACLSGLEIAWSAVPREIERIKGSTAAGNYWFEGPPATLRVVDGPSEWLDRNAAVEAIGDTNPPQMMTVIGRAIQTAERL